MKTKSISKGLISAMVIAMSIIFMSFTLVSSLGENPWEVPAADKSKANPVASDDESVSTGKSMYMKYCASCHGKTGLGNGVKARSLETFPGDLTKEAYQGQTDGEQFYKTKIGRDEMPAYKGKVEDEDIWNIVNYMRTFKK